MTLDSGGENHLDDFHSTIVMTEMLADEKLIFARFEDPTPRMIMMTKMAAAAAVFVLFLEIGVRHKPVPPLWQLFAFAFFWLLFLYGFRKAYKCIDAITNKRFMRIRPGVSLHYGWLKDIEKIVVPPRGEKRNLDIFLKPSGVYEARNLKQRDTKPRQYRGVKKFTIAFLSNAPQIKSTIEDTLAFRK